MYSNLNRILLLSLALTVGVPYSGISDINRPSKFISSKKISELEHSTIANFISAFGQSRLSMLKYGVNSYRVVYETRWKGETIHASGLVLIPAGIKSPAPIISIQHGTTFSNGEVPSSGSYTGMELIASAGFIVVMPDYLGYGSSSQIFHPYYDKHYSAQTVIDMINSSKEFLRKEKIEYNDKLFMAGYSEGGYVTLAAAEAIERNPSSDLKLSGVAVGAGGYDMMEMLKDVSSNDFYSYPAYLAFVIMSYDKTYDWNRSADYYFSSRYADVVKRSLTSGRSGWSINSQLTSDLSKLFASDFYARVKKADGEPELKAALKRNTITGWKTSTPIRLYHGTADEIIPYSNSETTLDSFHQAGSSHVTLTRIERGTHSSSLVPMLQNFLPWLNSLN